MDVSLQAIVTMAVDGGGYGGHLSSYVLHDSVIPKMERIKSRPRISLKSVIHLTSR